MRTISQKGLGSLSPGVPGDQKSCCVEGHVCEWEAGGKTFIFAAAAAAEAAAP